MRVWSALGAAALAGAAVGGYLHPTWTDNVESAQVLAGVVRPEAGGPMALYHTGVYSLAIQLAAVLLRSGLTEWQVSVIFSALQGALSFAAVTACTLTVARSRAVALLAPFVFLAWRQAFPEWPAHYLTAFHGHAYPILFPNHASLYGVLGLFHALLALSLLALDRTAAAAFLFGLLPAVHPAWGIGAWIAAAIGILATRATHAIDWRRAAPFFAAGVLLFAISAGVHVAVYGVPDALLPGIGRQYAVAFQRYWNEHVIVNPARLAVMALSEPEIYVVLLAVTLMRLTHDGLPLRVRVLVGALLGITATIAGALIALVVFPEAQRPLIEQIFVIRWLNLNSIAFPCLAIGLAGWLAIHRRNALALGLLAVVSALVAVRVAAHPTLGSALARWGPGFTARHVVAGVWFPLFVAGACALAYARSRVRIPTGPAAGAVCAMTIVLATATLWREHRRHDPPDAFDANPEVMAALRRGSGTLAIYTTDPWRLGRSQLRTRRPVLLDLTQINLLSYVPDASAPMQRILERLYGASLEDVRGMRSLGGAAPLWQHRPIAEWQQLAREFSFTEVLTDAATPLQLPLVAKSADLALFSVPRDRAY
jgi:hypothetical protein